MNPPIPANESARLSALRQYHILDTAPEAAFDELTRLAAQICETPMASVTFIDEYRQWLKAKIGMEVSETERSLAFCAHTVAGDDLLLINDAAQDERFHDNPFVVGAPGIRFYAGMPLVTPEGLNVGSLCVIDTVPRELKPTQLEALRTLSRQAMAQLELRPDIAAGEVEPKSRRERLAERRRERSQAAQTLKQADARYRALFDTAQEGILIVDVNSGLIADINPYLSEILGTQARLLMERYVWQVAELQPLFGSDNQWKAMCQKLRETGDIRVSEIELPVGEEREMWVEFRAHLFESEGYTLARCNLRDVTQSKLDRESLRAQEKHHRTFVELSLNAIVVMNDEGRIIEWNPAAETMFGHSRAKVIGQDLADIIVPPALRQWHRDSFQRNVLTGESKILGQRVEVSALRADGSEFPVELAIARHDDAGGPIFIASLRDMTDRKNVQNAMQRATDELELHVIERTAELSESNAQLQLKIADHQRAEERLAATAQRLRGVLESISDAFVSLDSDWRFTYINESAQHLMGKSRDELLGREVWEGFPNAYETIFDKEWCDATCSGQPVTIESYYAPWKIWLEIHAYPSDEGLSIYFQDISARRADQCALEEAKREADAANAAKSEFLGRMSHELRTPLNAILGFGQILDKQELTPLQCESVGYILKSGEHLLELINEVLDISRVESGQVELNLEPVEIVQAIAEACDIVRPLADARAISLVQPRPAQDNAPHIFADAQRLKQVLINLLSNGIKYNFEKGEVEISWHAHGEDRWRISVRDSGPGISSKHLPRLFVPFERGAATDSGIEGTGLGLSLTLHLVEAMEGNISVESALGHGSTFSFDLPRACPPVLGPSLAIAPAEAETVADEMPCSYRVLCIEDNASNLRLIELVMATRPEITLVSAGCGEAGLELARAHEPDLILLDLNLPDMHGSQVLKHLQSDAATRDIPIIVVSADATAAQIEILLDEGVSEYLTKPLDMRRLLQTLDRMLYPLPLEGAEEMLV